MIDRIFNGSTAFKSLILGLIVLIGCGLGFYLWQLDYGLGLTGLGRDVSWGFYIAQFTFLVGVAASAVVVVLPYYLHNYAAFGKLTALGEFLAVASVLMCALFIFVDLGQPARVANMLLNPSPNSPMFWDMIVLMGYLALNLVIGWVVLNSERHSVPPPRWIRPLIVISIPWAISIHTVTAFLYAGLPGRDLWLTAVLAPRFLASAFASGPCLLIMLALLLRRVGAFDVGLDSLRKLATIVTYALIANVFFVLVEAFSALYSQIPGPVDSLRYMYFGQDGHAALVPWTWLSAALCVIALLLLLLPRARNRTGYLIAACATVFVAVWIDKGLGLIVGGLSLTPLGHVAAYTPTVPELFISLGVYACGALVLAVMYRILSSVKSEIAET